MLRCGFAFVVALSLLAAEVRADTFALVGSDGTSATGFTTQAELEGAVSNTVLEGWDGGFFSAGQTIEHGSKFDGITYRASSLNHGWFSGLRIDSADNFVTGEYGSRTAPNALTIDVDRTGVFDLFGVPENLFTRLDIMEFEFDQAVNSFGISFLNQAGASGGETYTITGINTQTGETWSVDSGADPFAYGPEEPIDPEKGRFAGLTVDGYFDQVRISVNHPAGAENVSYALDNMIYGRPLSGSVNVTTVSEGGIGFIPLFGPDAGFGLFDPRLSPLGGGLGQVGGLDPNTQFTFGGNFWIPGASPHMYTTDPLPIDPDVQAAYVAANDDLLLGGFDFQAYVMDVIAMDPSRLPELEHLLVPGGYDPTMPLMDIPEDVWMGFVASKDPNPHLREYPGQFLEMVQSQWDLITDPNVMFSVSSGTVEEIIFPHYPEGTPVLIGGIQTIIGPDGKPILDFSNAFAGPVPVPEPGTYALFGLALAGAVIVRRRRRKNAA